MSLKIASLKIGMWRVQEYEIVMVKQHKSSIVYGSSLLLQA